MARELLLWCRALATYAALFGALCAWKVLGMDGPGGALRFYIGAFSISSLAFLFPSGGSVDRDMDSHARAAFGNGAALLLCFALAWFGETGMAIVFLVAKAILLSYRRRCLALRTASERKGG